MRLMQILLSQSEAGAETYFEKVVSAMAEDPSITQKVIIEQLPSREQRLQQAGVDFQTLPMGRISKPLLYNHILKSSIRRFSPDLIVTWVNRASRKCPKTDAVIVGRLGGYYDINNYRKCDHLIVNTPDLVRHVVESGWDRHRVTMISNFGELPDALNVPSQIPEVPGHHKTLLSLGRLHEKKAHDIIIKALPQIPDATLLIAGSGDLKPSLEALARKLGVANRVQFLGLRKDIRQLFDLADICVFPSRFEPLGNVILEAWATGTPVVAAASQGPSWLINDHENGLLFKVDSPDDCARAVNELLQNSALAKLLTENGLKTFQKNYSRSVIISQYKSLFEQLITEHKKQKNNQPKLVLKKEAE